VQRTYPTAGLWDVEQLHPLCDQYTISFGALARCPGLFPVRRAPLRV